jgi:Rrf2 family protein
MITREADYSIRTILYLTEKGVDGEAIPAQQIADDMDIPYRFLRKIARQLTLAGFLTAVKGRNGGLRLNRDPKSLSLLDVLAATSPSSVALNKCIDDESTCARSAYCTVHRRLRALQNRIDAELGDITFGSLL